MLLIKIAFRNIFRQTRRSVLTALAMTGGFVLASVSIAWSDGSYNDVINLFTRSRLGHIQVHAETYLDRPTLYKTIRDVADVGGIIETLPDVEAWAPRVLSAGLVSVGEHTAAAQIIGVDPERENSAVAFDRKVVEGQPLTRGGTGEALLGRGLAELLHAAPGDSVVVVSQGADGSIANDVYTVVGLVDTGDDASNLSDFYLTLSEAQTLLALGGRVHEVVVVVSSLRRVQGTTRDLADRLQGRNLDVAPWQVFAKDFHKAMQADRAGMWITLGVIIVVVAVGVLNTVLMAVLERRREYGLLKAMGTRPWGIFKIIVLEIDLIAVGSIGLGTVVALAANYLLTMHGIQLPEPMTYGGVEFSDLHSEMNLRSYVIPAITVLATASLVALIPAWQAVRTDPARAMRVD